MNWIDRFLGNWFETRRVRALKKKVARMKSEAEEAEIEPLMPAVETISRKIRLERIDVLEKAIDKIEADQAGHGHSRK